MQLHARISLSGTASNSFLIPIKLFVQVQQYKVSSTCTSASYSFPAFYILPRSPYFCWLHTRRERKRGTGTQTVACCTSFAEKDLPRNVSIVCCLPAALLLIQITGKVVVVFVCPSFFFLQLQFLLVNPIYYLH